MSLSIELIAQSLESFGSEILLAQDIDFHFNSVQILGPDEFDDLQEDVLYISQTKILRKLPRACFKNHCFVFSSSSASMERYRPIVNAIIYDDRHPVSKVINHLFELFGRINSLEKDMKLATHMADNSFDPIIQVAKRMFSDSVLVVVDSAYNIIASTSDAAPTNAHLNRVLTQGYFDKEYMQGMANIGYFDKGDLYVKPHHSYPPNVSGLPMIIRSYHSAGFFYSFAALYFLNGGPSLIDDYLFTIFTNELDEYFKVSGFYGQSIPTRQQMLDDLITNTNMTPEFVRERCQQLWLPETGNFVLGYIEFPDSYAMRSSHLASQIRAWCKIKTYGIFNYRDSVLILFRDRHDYPLAEQVTFREFWNELINIVKTNKARLGVSLLFTSIGMLRSAYFQAKSALNIGYKLDPEKLEYHYSKYYIYDMLQKYSEKLALEDVYMQHLDKLSSDSGNASNLHLLYHFINSERNISLTAKKVHMHRNSVIYRLQKIQDTIHFNLDDPDVRLRILISFKILEMLGRLPDYVINSDEDEDYTSD